MKVLVMAMVLVAVTAGPALAFQCPLLVKQLNDHVATLTRMPRCSSSAARTPSSSRSSRPQSGGRSSTGAVGWSRRAGGVSAG